MMEYGLNIDQRGAQLAISTSMPQSNLSVQQPQAELKTKDAAFIIDIQQPQIEIDYTECYRSMGRYAPVDLTLHQAQVAKSDVLAFIDKKSLEGDRLAAFETGFTIVDAVKMWEDQPEEYDVGLIPSVPPDINFILVDPKVSVDPGHFSFNYSPGQVTVNPTGGVQVSLKDPGYIKITPTYMGRTIDLMA